jgi:hypothetical protein
VVVDGRVDVVLADPPTPWSRGGAAVDAVAATIGDAAQLLDIQVDQLAGSLSLIAADHPTGRPVHPGQPTQAMADQHAMTVEAGRPTRGAIRAGPSLWVRRSRQISASTAAGTWWGWVWAVLGRSTRPAGPCCW